MPLNHPKFFALAVLLLATTTRTQVQCQGASGQCLCSYCDGCTQYGADYGSLKCGNGKGPSCTNDFQWYCCDEGGTCGKDDFNAWCCPPGCTPSGETYERPPSGGNEHCMTIDNYSASCDCSGAAEFVKPATEDESSDASKESGEGLESCTVQKTRQECRNTDGCTFDNASKKCVGKEESGDASQESGEASKESGEDNLESCAVQTTRAECRKTDGCMYDTDSNKCVGAGETCEDLGSRRNCEDRSGCLWLGGKNGQCFDQAGGCATKKKRKPCEKQSGCSWAGRKKGCTAGAQ